MIVISCYDGTRVKIFPRVRALARGAAVSAPPLGVAAAETAPGELRDAAEKASFHMSSAKMPLSSNPKVLLYNRSVHAHTGLLAYQQQVKPQHVADFVLEVPPLLLDVVCGRGKSRALPLVNLVHFMGQKGLLRGGIALEGRVRLWEAVAWLSEFS